MASTSPTVADGARPDALPNKPQTKLPPIPKGTRIQKRPLPGPSPSTRPRNPPRAAPSSPDLLALAADSDGYTPPPLASHTIVVKVSSGASFMSLVRRVRKALEKAPSRRAGRDSRVPLAARVASATTSASTSISRSSGNAGRGEAGAATGQKATGVIGDRLDDVMLVATGRAIERAVEIGGFFTRERELAVLVRTRTVRAVDDVVVVDEEADAEAEDQVRVRNVSCVEVGIRWTS
ncbi:hypothetical protein N657DRAFT_679611 [Parathielavia appendiculata]|uniref:Uncharacterized protein n=1 Tax=Parathielavia appendiculata TaxID=2587402 RepID=A0AAN6U1M3_9PEZI|nr:hypothetical protein N657DRAFT_679611 [Parathielavia appendiculata]